MSTTETVVEKAKEVQAKFFPNIKINYVKPFYNRDLYINCLAESIKEKLPENFDFALSFRIMEFQKDIFTKQTLPKLVK